MKQRVVIWAVVAAIGLSCAGYARELPEFTVVVPEPLATEIGDLGNVFLLHISGRGEAAGQAHGSVPGRTAGAAVRYSAERGLESLDPLGNFNSAMWQINDAGLAYGSDFANRGQIALFLHDGSEFAFIHEDRTREFVSGFKAFGMNASGVLVGATGQIRLGPVQAWRYSLESGWRDFTSFDGRFRRNSRAELINDRGDVVLTYVPELTLREGYLATAEGTLMELGDLDGGQGFLTPLAMNERGQVVGGATAAEGRDHGFLFTPGEGIVEIHPEGHRMSAAMHVTPNGVVAGASNRVRGGAADTLFVRRPGRELRPVVRRIRFKRLAAASGLKYRAMYVQGINDRLEFVGSVYGRGRAPLNSIPFLYSRKTGLINLNEIVASAGVGFTATEALGVNNAGQIYLSVTDGERRTTAILTPVE